MNQVTDKSNKDIVSDFYAIMGDLYHIKKMNVEAYAAYDSALVYKENNIGALNNYAYYLSVERKNLDKAEEMSYRTVKANLPMVRIWIHMPGYFLRKVNM